MQCGEFSPSRVAGAGDSSRRTCVGVHILRAAERGFVLPTSRPRGKAAASHRAPNSARPTENTNRTTPKFPTFEDEDEFDSGSTVLSRNDAVALGSVGVSPAVFGVPPKTIVATRRRTVW